MSYSMNNLPDSFKRCMERGQKKALGKSGLTMQEIDAKNEAQSEKELQKQIVGMLQLRGYVVNYSRMDKRKTDKVGWPDITFCCQGHMVCFEVKTASGKVSKEQEMVKERLLADPNKASVHIVRSLDDAKNTVTAHELIAGLKLTL
jgi:hypothetical protein